MRYRFTPIYAIVFTVLWFMLLHTFSGSYPYQIFVRRGPVQYFTTFMTFFTISMTLAARYHRDYRVPMIIGLYGFSLFPVIAGMLAYFATISSALSNLSLLPGLIAMNSGTGELIETISGSFMGVQFAVDALHLGLLSAVLTWSIILWHCTTSNKEKQ